MAPPLRVSATCQRAPRLGLWGFCQLSPSAGAVVPGGGAACWGQGALSHAGGGDCRGRGSNAGPQQRRDGVGNGGVSARQTLIRHLPPEEMGC